MIRHVLFSLVVFACFCSAALFAEAQTAPATPAAANPESQAVVVYPAPAEEKLSEDFELKINGQNVPVYECRVSAMPFNQVWPGYQRPLDQTELASFAYWDMASPVDVEVVSHRPVESLAVRPTSRGIQTQVENNRIRFRLPSPQQITVEVNGWHKALHLFANPMPAAAPDPKDPNVRYFGPGVHRPGKIVLESNQTVYIAGGAVVHGIINAKDASNIKVLGRGILDTSEFERNDNSSDYQWSGWGCIHLEQCKNIEIEGVILRDPNVWCLSIFNSSDIAISNVKLIGLWRYNADGIDLCNSQRATVRNCFVRSFDDSLVVKGLAASREAPAQDILFEGCVVWNDWGRALEIGAETVAPEMARITFRDCDILRTVNVAMDIQHGDRAAVKDVLFDKIRFEVDDVNSTPRIQTNREEKYTADTSYIPHFLVLEIIQCCWSQDKVRGTMENVTVRDCTISGKPRTPSILRGFDAEHEVKNVTIANLRINGQVAKSLEEAAVKVDPHVRDVHIQSNP